MCFQARMEDYMKPQEIAETHPNLTNIQAEKCEKFAVDYE